MDGLSNCFIFKNWPLLRTPLHRYLKHCLQTGTLTNTFRTEKIKIIPKKGDIKKIGNWRPISLLSCLYKVTSQALNSRLKKICDTVFSRVQKGFTSERHVQEVFINVIEGIAHCKQHNIPACRTCGMAQLASVRRGSVGTASARCKAGPSLILGSAPQGSFPH